MKLRINLMNKTKVIIKVDQLYKIFGANTIEALGLVKDGMGKDELLEKAKCVLGLDNINLNIAWQRNIFHESWRIYIRPMHHTHLLYQSVNVLNPRIRASSFMSSPRLVLAIVHYLSTGICIWCRGGRFCCCFCVTVCRRG